jgi:hypothetical protein
VGFFAFERQRAALSDKGQQVEIANFQNHHLAFIDPKRGPILKRKGEPRSYRFGLINQQCSRSF